MKTNDQRAREAEKRIDAAGYSHYHDMHEIRRKIILSALDAATGERDKIIGEMVGLLLKNEWHERETSQTITYSCLFCGAFEENGHDKDCALAAVIARAKEVGK